MSEFLQQVVNDRESTNTIVAMIALIVAVISLVTAITSTYLQTRHNRKSVVPIAQFTAGDYENKLVVALQNKGVGPLIIHSFTATVDGKTADSIISFAPAPPAGVFWETFTGNLTDRCLYPGDTLELALLTGDSGDGEFCGYRDQVRSILKDMLIEVSYSDVYGKRQRPKIRHLEWFGRRLDRDDA